MKEGRPQPQRPNHHPDDNNRNNNRSRSRKSHQRMAFFLGMVSFATSGIRTATNTNSIANRVSGVALASWVVTPLPVAPHRQQQQQHRQQPQHHQYHRLFAASTHKNQRIVIATPQPSKHTATTTTTTAQPNRRVRPQQQQQLPPLLRNTNASMPVVALGSIGNDRPATATTPILSTTTSTAATATARTRTTPPPSSTPPPTTTPTMHTDNTKPDLRLLNLATATRADLTALIVDGLHHPKFRVDQVWQWIRGDAGVTDPYAMHNVPRALQVQLDTYCKTSRSSSSTTTSASSKGGSLLHCVLEQVSKVDGTIKRAYQCNSDATTINNNIDNKPTLIESVLMGPYRDGRYTACISSQAGCAQGCVFCATGQMGLTRQLTSDEILEQVVQFQNLLKQQNKKNIAANKKNKTNAESNDTESSSAPVSSSLPTTARLSNIVFMGMGEVSLCVV